jgi:hypothetical protein
MGILGDIIGGVTSIFGGNAQKKAADKAAAAQIEAARIATEEQRRQFDLTRSDNMPWLSAGSQALGGQLDLIGLGGSANSAPDWGKYLASNPDVLSGYYALSEADKKQFPDPESYAKWHYSHYGQQEGRANPVDTRDPAAVQQAAIDALKAGPQYQSQYRNGTEAILQNGSATGGLRGGNMQHSLANFGSDLLGQVIDAQFAKLGGLSGQGQQTGQYLGKQGQETANNIGQLAVGAGNASAGRYLSQGQITANQWKAGGDALSSILNTTPVPGLKF